MSKATPNLTMLNALTEFSRLTQDKIKDKSAKQLSVWRSQKVTAVTKWVQMFGEIPLNRIERSHVIEFRDRLSSQINDKAMKELRQLCIENDMEGA